MVDIVTNKTRSRMMAAIGSKNTKPEVLVRKFLHSQGFRFRSHQKICGCRPDIVLPKYRTCIFVHGCFWHRHAGCKLASMPKTRREFWEDKFESNVTRDRRVTKQLELNEWKVVLIWECETRDGSFKEIDFRRLFAADPVF
jgi:DNA mismatch endonuclease, patch repair protein